MDKQRSSEAGRGGAAARFEPCALEPLSQPTLDYEQFCSQKTCLHLASHKYSALISSFQQREPRSMRIADALVRACTRSATRSCCISNHGCKKTVDHLKEKCTQDTCTSYMVGAQAHPVPKPALAGLCMSLQQPKGWYERHYASRLPGVVKLLNEVGDVHANDVVDLRQQRNPSQPPGQRVIQPSKVTAQAANFGKGAAPPGPPDKPMSPTGSTPPHSLCNTRQPAANL